MKINRLDHLGLCELFSPIFQLEKSEIVKERISSYLKFNWKKVNDESQFLISSKTSGIKNLFYGYEIIVKMISDRPYGWPATVIQFHKNKPWYNFIQKYPADPFDSIKAQIDIDFLNPELEAVQFRYQIPFNLKREEMYIHKGASNSNWKEPENLQDIVKVPINLEPSPLSIYIRETEKSVKLDFRFFPECYCRENGKTVLRDNWQDILNR